MLFLIYNLWLQDSLIKPVTKILFGVAIITIVLTLFLKESPVWVEKLNIFGGSFPPWILACVVIVFTRMRKRTKDLLKKFGWWKNKIFFSRASSFFKPLLVLSKSSFLHNHPYIYTSVVTHVGWYFLVDDFGVFP